MLAWPNKFYCEWFWLFWHVWPAKKESLFVVNRPICGKMTNVLQTLIINCLGVLFGGPLTSHHLWWGCQKTQYSEARTNAGGEAVDRKLGVPSAESCLSDPNRCKITTLVSLTYSFLSILSSRLLYWIRFRLRITDSLMDVCLLVGQHGFLIN